MSRVICDSAVCLLQLVSVLLAHLVFGSWFGNFAHFAPSAGALRQRMSKPEALLDLEVAQRDAACPMPLFSLRPQPIAAIAEVQERNVKFRKGRTLKAARKIPSAFVSAWNSFSSAWTGG